VTHRKHIHEWEAAPVAQAIREQLTLMIPLKEPRSPLAPDEEAVFRVLYRLERNEVGKPDYPQPSTWGTVSEYLGIPVSVQRIAHKAEKMDPFPQAETPPAEKMVPFSEPDPEDMDPFPETCPKCGAPLVNPNYCNSCGANLRLPTLEVSA